VSSPLIAGACSDAIEVLAMTNQRWHTVSVSCVPGVPLQPRKTWRQREIL